MICGVQLKHELPMISRISSSTDIQYLQLPPAEIFFDTVFANPCKIYGKYTLDQFWSGFRLCGDICESLPYILPQDGHILIFIMF